MTFLQTAILAVVQGFAELLPVSSSAHVIVAEKLLGLDPTAPEMTLLLVLLHTGTMLAVLAYFWNGWKKDYFSGPARTKSFIGQIVLATGATGVVGLALLILVEKVILRGEPHAEVESLFGNLGLMAVALAASGLWILYAASREDRVRDDGPLGARESIFIGLLQGLCLPFRGFSRSGATISAGLVAGVPRLKTERFSFALAVVLTPPVLAREIHRLWKAREAVGALGLKSDLLLGAAGMAFSFAAAWLALVWLSDWLEKGRWKWFGGYCLGFSLFVGLLRFFHMG